MNGDHCSLAGCYFFLQIVGKAATYFGLHDLKIIYLSKNIYLVGASSEKGDRFNGTWNVVHMEVAVMAAAAFQTNGTFHGEPEQFDLAVMLPPCHAILL
jgi:hypothetical protein